MANDGNAWLKQFPDLFYWNAAKSCYEDILSSDFRVEWDAPIFPLRAGVNRLCTVSPVFRLSPVASSKRGDTAHPHVTSQLIGPLS